MRRTDSPTSSSDPTPASVAPADLRRVAVTIAEAAAEHVRSRRPEVFGVMGAELRADDGQSVRAKSTPTDPVTVVDTEAEQLIRARLSELRPHDAILGEEGGGAHGVAGIRWVVDPIDGTVNFLYGIPAYSVSVAAQIDGVSVAGAVVDVAARVTYSAAAGDGARFVDSSSPDGVVEGALSCNPITDASSTLLATGFGYDAERRRAQGRLIGELLPHVRDIRRVGSAALDLCMVASGRVDAHFEHGLNPWDWAAGALIAIEAGARVHVPGPDVRGASGEVVVAMAPGIADDLDAVMRSVGVYTPIP
ncbi:inositol monophosphatase family protein [Rhodococcus sp. OK519]|uniref:inositol monophosphatase family protein n=1 Tax=Rhodococcus sp. OK519 TaxID=2135729 RepID=UPI000D39937E